MSSQTKTLNNQNDTDSLINVDEIVSRYMDENNIKESDFDNSEIIFSQQMETRAFNVNTQQLNTNQSSSTNTYKDLNQQKNDILKEIEAINNQLNSLENKFGSTQNNQANNYYANNNLDENEFVFNEPIKNKFNIEDFQNNNTSSYQEQQSSAQLISKKPLAPPPPLPPHPPKPVNNETNAQEFETLTLENDDFDTINEFLLNNISKIQPEYDPNNSQTKKPNLEEKISFNTEYASQDEDDELDKKPWYSIFKKQKTNYANNQASNLTSSIDSQNQVNNQQLLLNQKLENKRLRKQIPHFYKFEIFVIYFWIAVSSLLFIASIVTLGILSYKIANEGYNGWLLLPQLIFNFVCIIALGLNIISLVSANKELKINNYVLNRELPSAFIKKKYKSIITFNILCNWYSGATYLLWGFGILLTFIVAYFVNLTNYQVNQFGLLDINGDVSPMIVVIIFGVLIGVTFFIQLTSLLFNKKRQSEIDMYYQKEVISEEMVLKYKKQANKKGAIIFFSMTFILTFTVLITWFILRRRAKKTVNVKV